MNSAFAHEQIYPHIHPHATTSVFTDTLLTWLFLIGVGLAWGVFFVARNRERKRRESIRPMRKSR